MQVSSCEKDIGIYVDKHLTFETHIETKVNTANSIMGIIRRSFTYLDEEIFTLLFKALVRRHFEYTQSVWSPYLKKHINLKENVQCRSTKLIPGFKDLSWGKATEIKTTYIKISEIKGDMIEVYKILHGVYDKRVTSELLNVMDHSWMSGHSLKLAKHRSKLELRKIFFTSRVVNVWNSLM